MNEVKIPKFSDAMDSFLIFAETVLSYSPQGFKKVDENSRNKFKIHLGYYKVIFNKMRESKMHQKLFTEVYRECRPLMIKFPDMEEFMTAFINKTFIIKPSERSDSKIYLTAIFRYCNRVAEELDDQYEKGNVGAHDDAASMFPESFMLHLFRLFSFCADETDKKELIAPRIELLEQSLGLRPHEVPSTGGSGFDKIFHFTKNMAKEFGVEIPEGMDNTSMAQIEKTLTQLTKNEQLKDSVKKIIGNTDYRDPSKIQDMISNLAKMMGDTAKNPPPELLKAMEVTSDGNK